MAKSDFEKAISFFSPKLRNGDGYRGFDDDILRRIFLDREFILVDAYKAYTKDYFKPPVDVQRLNRSIIRKGMHFPFSRCVNSLIARNLVRLQHHFYRAHPPYAFIFLGEKPEVGAQIQAIVDESFAHNFNEPT